MDEKRQVLIETFTTKELRLELKRREREKRGEQLLRALLEPYGISLAQYRANIARDRARRESSAAR